MERAAIGNDLLETRSNCARTLMGVLFRKPLGRARPRTMLRRTYFAYTLQSRIGDPDSLIRVALQGMWGQLSPDV